MKPIGCHNYFVYILTNKLRSVLYTGVTNNLKARIYEHYMDSVNHKDSFAGKYNCYNLIWFEHFDQIEEAIIREKQIKGWSRMKKEKLINSFNPDWRFLNDEID
jgi:putative endonuclease